jgi:hypothetical protein
MHCLICGAPLTRGMTHMCAVCRLNREWPRPERRILPRESRPQPAPARGWKRLLPR